MPPDPEVEATQDALEEIGSVAALELVAIWDSLGSYNRADIARFVAAARPIILPAATSAVRIQSALVGITTGTTPVIDPAPIAVKQLERLQEPFHATWHALSERRPYEEAVRVGQSDMEAEGLDVAHRTARDAMAEIAKTDPRLSRVKRVANVGACEWCQKRDGGIYPSAADATYGHKRCKCSAVPAPL